MRGFVRKRERGNSTRWYVVTVDDDGKQHPHGGHARKRDAQAALRSILTQADSGTYVEPSKLTVEQWLDQWLRTLRTRSLVKASTLTSYTLHVERYIAPRIGNIPLQTLSAAHLNGLYDDLLENGRIRGDGGLSDATVHRIHSTLHKSLQDALEAGLVTHNVATRAKATKDPEASPDAWTAEELRTFLESTQDERDAALWRLASHTGMREGEIANLRWPDLDLEYATVTITEGKTKRSRRTIDLDPTTVAMQKQHKKRQMAERLAGGPLYHQSDHVFTREDGRPIRVDSTSKRFHTLRERAGLRRIRFHDLRGTHATLLLKAGVPLHVVSRRLGHATEAFTAQRYASVLPQQGADAAAKFASVVDG